VRPAARPSDVVVSAPAVSDETLIPIDQNQLVVISMDEQGARRIVDVSQELALNDDPNGVDPFYTLFNDVEALAFLQ
jgi:hypothetical protein